MTSLVGRETRTIVQATRCGEHVCLSGCQDVNEAIDGGVLGRQWHQLDHMQTVWTSLQTDNHTSTSSVNCYRPDSLPDAEPAVSKHWRMVVTCMPNFGWIGLSCRFCQPSTTTTFAKRAYRCSAPAVWNSLPKTVLNSDSVAVFKSRLKTFLFSRAFSLPSAQ